MSGRRPDAPAETDPAESATVEYLRNHPELFERHPELVDELRIPHACGEAVSLVEYQVNVLRERNRELRERMYTLVSNARDNEELGQRIHRLTLSLIECSDVAEVFGRLYQALTDEFQVDFASLRLFAVPAREDNLGLTEFVEPEQASLFADALADGRPTCGRLGREQARFLFAEHGGEVGSGALIPLELRGRPGVMAVASRDQRRYHPGMGTMFLRQLGEAVATAVRPHVRRP